MNSAICKQKLLDCINLDILLNKKVCVAEEGYSNADPILFDLAFHLKYSIYSMYDTTQSYNTRLIRLFPQSSVNVQSYFNDDKYPSDNDFILDDAVSANTVFPNRNKNSKIDIYRGGSCEQMLYYDYDLVIIVSPLISGPSPYIDGFVTIQHRDIIYYKLQFKLKPDGIYYAPC